MMITDTEKTQREKEKYTFFWLGNSSSKSHLRQYRLCPITPKHNDLVSFG